MLLEVATQIVAIVLLLRIFRSGFSTWIPGAVAAGAMLFIAWPRPQWESASSWLALEAVFFFALVGRKAGCTGAVSDVEWLVYLA